MAKYYFKPNDDLEGYDLIRKTVLLSLTTRNQKMKQLPLFTILRALENLST